MPGPAARLIGGVAGVATLIVIGVDVGLFTSGVGVVIAALGAFWIAAGLAALIEPAHAKRNASIVAVAIVAVVVLYLTVASTRPAPSGTSYGGPNVMPPVQSVP
jgi:hypothetical protein